MNITSVKYTTNDENKSLIVISDSQTLYVPIDSANRHYQEVQEGVAEGNTIEEAD